MTLPHHWTQPEPTEPRSAQSAYLPHADWHILDAVLAFAVGVIGVILTSIALAVLDIGPTAAVVTAELALVAFAFWFLIRRSRKRGTGSFTTDTGLTLHLRDWWAVPLGFALQIGIGLISAVVALLLLGEEGPLQEIGEVVTVSSDAFEVLALGFLAVVLAPLLEEVLFRAVLLRGLLRRVSVPAAIVISSALFSLIHLESLDVDQVPILVDTFLWGVVLAWFALRRGDLSFPLILHASANTLAVSSLLLL